MAKKKNKNNKNKRKAQRRDAKCLQNNDIEIIIEPDISTKDGVVLDGTNDSIEEVLLSYENSEDRLTINNIRFCREYIKNGHNGTKAYQEVYNVPYDSARASSSRLLKKKKIIDFIVEEREFLEKKGEVITSEEAEYELKKLLYSDNEMVKLKAAELILRRVERLEELELNSVDEFPVIHVK